MYSSLPFVSKIPHIIPIIPVYFVITEVIFTINYYIIFNSDLSAPVFKLLSVLLFEPLAIMTIITHLKSMFTVPGFVPIPYKPFEKPTTKDGETIPDLYCKKCSNPRPPRAHHCSVCKKCTLKMDHHCPWVANCIGYYNQKSFYQFLFCATIGDGGGFLLLLSFLWSSDLTISGNVPKGVKIKSVFTLIWYMWQPIQLFIACACALAMTISIGTLLIKQTYMLRNNQTTIDLKMYPKWYQSPYYSKDKNKNFNSVMGDTYLQWISWAFYGSDPFSFDKVQRYINWEEC